MASIRYKLFVLLLFVVAYCGFYVFPNLYPTSPPAFLPLMPVDVAIPLLPWTFIVYTSDYLLTALVIWIIKDEARFNRLARMSFSGLIAAGTFFLVFPTRYPRPIYPAVDNPMVQFFMNLISKADSPNNCFPSMHVAMTGIATWNLRERPKLFFLFSIWALLIFVSTLTTKQHYVIDIFGGIAVIFLAMGIEYAWCSLPWSKAHVKS